MAVSVVTDSASAIGAQDLARLSIVTVPLHVSDAGVEIPEIELLSEGFAHRLERLESLPQTSQPSPDELSLAFRSGLERGDSVLAVFISSGMSGTVRSAELARESILAEDPAARIEIVDSRSNSLEEGFAVLAAAEAALRGEPLEVCAQAARETTRRTRFLFTPHSLEYLRRGGRISRASALVSSMLRIAPILTAEDGTTGVAGVARSGKLARARIATMMRREVERFGIRRAAVQYFADLEGARRFASEIIEPIARMAVPVVPIHPVVGLHVGPAVGVVYETEQPLR